MTIVGFGRARFAALVIVATTGAVQTGALAQQAPSVPEVFQKYNLIGTFAWDCSKPASPNNLYFVNRVLGANHVQRDIMDGPSSSQHVTILSSAAETKPNEIAVSGTLDGSKPVTGVWRIEGVRMVPIEATESGRKIVADQKILATGSELPWLSKCD